MLLHYDEKAKLLYSTSPLYDIDTTYEVKNGQLQLTTISLFPHMNIGIKYSLQKLRTLSIIEDIAFNHCLMATYNHQSLKRMQIGDSVSYIRKSIPKGIPVESKHSYP